MRSVPPRVVRSFVVALAALASVHTPVGAQAPMARWVRTSVVERTGPGAEFDTLRVHAAGASLVVRSCDDGWCVTGATHPYGYLQETALQATAPDPRLADRRTRTETSRPPRIATTPRPAPRLTPPIPRGGRARPRLPETVVYRGGRALSTPAGPSRPPLPSGPVEREAVQEGASSAGQTARDTVPTTVPDTVPMNDRDDGISPFPWTPPAVLRQKDLGKGRATRLPHRLPQHAGRTDAGRTSPSNAVDPAPSSSGTPRPVVDLRVPAYTPPATRPGTP